jgi:hypothetical protein
MRLSFTGVPRLGVQNYRACADAHAAANLIGILDTTQAFRGERVQCGNRQGIMTKGPE